jgi:hypothetical protein
MVNLWRTSTYTMIVQVALLFENLADILDKNKIEAIF